jgi:hypothetical protein
MRREVVDIAAEEDLVFLHWRATATHEGQHQIHKHVRDMEPTGEEGTVSGISLYRIRGGKFVEHRSYHNLLEYILERGKAGHQATARLGDRLVDLGLFARPPGDG